MRDKTVCGFWAEILPLQFAGVDSASERSRTAHYAGAGFERNEIRNYGGIRNYAVIYA